MKLGFDDSGGSLLARDTLAFSGKRRAMFNGLCLSKLAPGQELHRQQHCWKSAAAPNPPPSFPPCPQAFVEQQDNDIKHLLKIVEDQHMQLDRQHNQIMELEDKVQEPSLLLLPSLLTLRELRIQPLGSGTPCPIWGAEEGGDHFEAAVASRQELWPATTLRSCLSTIQAAAFSD